MFMPGTARKNRHGGYTLLELIIVMVVLGLLAAIATPQVLKILGGARGDSSELQLEGLGGALTYYSIDVGRFPSQDEGLKALLERPANAPGWNGPYVQKPSQLLDPWGRAFIYEPNSEAGFALYTLGADGVQGGTEENQDVRLGQDRT